MVLYRIGAFAVLVAVTYVIGLVAFVAWASFWKHAAMGHFPWLRVAFHPLFCMVLVIEAFVLFVLKR